VFRNLTLRSKITGLLVFYFIVALVAIGSTLFVSWRLEGSAAAINDAGRQRMRSYRLAFLLSQQASNPSPELRNDIEREIILFERTLIELEQGNPQRPLSLPRNPVIRQQMNKLQQAWQGEIKPWLSRILNSASREEQEQALAEYRPALEHYVSGINDLVTMVEHSNAHATTLLRILQVALVSLALIGTVVLDFLFGLLVIRPVAKLQEGMGRMADADFDVRLPVNSQDELGQLAQGFNRMAGELQDIYQTLEQRVEEKTRSVEAKSRELAALDKEMAVSEERNLLAQELHDSIAQSLAFLNIQVQLLQDDLQKKRTSEALSTLEQIREGVQESYDDVRELLVHFRTRIGSTDLETALRSALEKFEAQTGVKTSYAQCCSTPELLPEQVLQIMHIVQESLSNVRKHAHATQVEVELCGEGECQVSIRDNGAGFDAAHDAGETHVGLRIMRERAHRIGARLSLTSHPGQGTRICLGLPGKSQEPTTE
jgi:nitrate/nitrite-specific signal transduction histidine kinase